MTHPLDKPLPSDLKPGEDYLHIGICIPTRDSWRSDFGQSLALLTAHFAHKGFRGIPIGIRIMNAKGSLLPALRRDMATQCLADDGATGRPITHILFLDDDMMFPANTLEKLLAADKDVVATNCVTKKIPATFTAQIGYEKVKTMPDSTGLQKVDTVGTAVMLIRADVFKKIKSPWFATPHYEADMQDCFYKLLEDTKAIEGQLTDKYKKDFAYLMDKLDRNYFQAAHTLGDGYTGEDVFFCRRCKAEGVDIWIDHDLSKDIAHIGEFYYSFHNTTEWSTYNGKESSEGVSKEIPKEITPGGNRKERRAAKSKERTEQQAQVSI